MFRLIQLRPGDWTASPYVHGDGYTSEAGAWSAYARNPGGFFGIGHLDGSGRLYEVIVDPACPNRHGVDAGRCLGAVTVAVRGRVYLRRCARCARGDDAIALDDLARQLGVTIRTAAFTSGQERRVRTYAPPALTERIANDLAKQVVDPHWRRSVCADLVAEPAATDGLVSAVCGLTDWEVLDLFPFLRELAVELPRATRKRLEHGLDNRESRDGIAAARLGMTTPRQAR